MYDTIAEGSADLNSCSIGAQKSYAVEACSGLPLRTVDASSTSWKGASQKFVVRKKNKQTKKQVKNEVF